MTSIKIGLRIIYAIKKQPPYKIQQTDVCDILKQLGYTPSKNLLPYVLPPIFFNL